MKFKSIFKNNVFGEIKEAFQNPQTFVQANKITIQNYKLLEIELKSKNKEIEILNKYIKKTDKILNSLGKNLK